MLRNEHLLYQVNCSTADSIQNHLTICDPFFTPALRARVAIADYAAKLVAHATRFEAWSDETLVGLVALYCDDVERERAFVTNVSVVPDWTRRGIARELLTSALNHAGGLGFHQVSLRVDCNAPVHRLYRSLGFDSDRNEKGNLRMSLELR